LRREKAASPLLATRARIVSPTYEAATHDDDLVAGFGSL
jgi:hypothetical protein